jgi:glycosyltransferase involved in cell wall biosynthesis
VVINSAFNWLPFNKEKHSNVQYIYDLVDDCFEEKELESFCCAEILKCDSFVTINDILKIKIGDYLKKHNKNIPVTVLLNGTDIDKLRNVPSEEVDELRSKWGLNKDDIVAGYVGYFLDWGGLPFIIDVFKQLGEINSKYKLMIIGGGPGMRNISIDSLPSNVIYTNYVSPAVIHKYFNLLSIGLLCFESNDLTNNCLPIKVLEHGITRRFVISTPLKILTQLKFPNVYFADLDHPQKWMDYFIQLKDKKWNPEWDKLYEVYDWAGIVKKLDAIIN